MSVSKVFEEKETPTPETPIVTPEVPTPTPATPEIDVEKIKAETEAKLRETLFPEITQKVNEEVVNKIVKAFKGETEEKKSSYITQSPWEKDGREKPASLDESLQFVMQEMEARRQAQELEIKKTQEEMTKKQEQEAIQNAERLQSEWKAQFDDLREKGKIPPVAPELLDKVQKGGELTKEDIENDEGLQAQLFLLNAMKEHQVMNAKEAFLDYYKAEELKSKRPQGADAPVSAGKRSGGELGDKNFSYEDLKKPISQWDWSKK